MFIRLPAWRLILSDWPPPRNAWPLTMSLNERGNVEDVEVLLVDLQVAHQALKAVGPDADHESTGRGLFDRRHDVGERPVGERIVPVGLTSVMFMPGMLGSVPGSSPAPTGGGFGLPGNTPPPGITGGGAGHLDRRHVGRRLERTVRAERHQTRHSRFNAMSPARREAGTGAGTRSTPEPGSCILAWLTSCR